MNTRMTHGPEQLMIFFFGLVIIVVGSGLVTGPDPQPETAVVYSPLAPVPVPAPLVTIPTVPPQQKASIIPVNRTFPKIIRQSYQPVLVPANPAPAFAMQTPAPLAITPAPQQQILPIILVKQVAPKVFQEPSPVAALPVVVPTTPAASPQIKMLPFQEAHWQGIEVIPLTGGLRKILKISPDAQGVIADDVTPPADMQGFQAGDLITSVGQIPTPTLDTFIKAADRVRDRRRTEIRLLRKNRLHSLVLTAYQDRLGTANGEAAPMIKPGSTPPHAYKGPCTECHNIGTKGQLPVDQGDLLTRKAPTILAGQTRPHRDRGECVSCHKIIK